MYGIGYISKTLSDTLHVGGGLGKLPPMRSMVGNAFVIDYVPLSEIYTDEKNFQNRGDKYSEKSVKGIIDAVSNGNFNWFAFDPVILWENPQDGKKYVLSGHSRTQAFRLLNQMHPDWIVDGLRFSSIPARIYRGSFDDAKRLALNSNTLATPETLTERAAYYRRVRDRQGIKKGKDLKSLKDKALRENNGQMIWDLSYLPEGGISFDSLKAFKLGEEAGSTENFLRLATICQWIGKAFQIYKGLSKAHDRELFNFLMSGGYGSKSGQYFNFTSLNDRLQKLYAKNVADDKKVNANGEYTEPFQIAAYKKDDATLDTLDSLKKDADGAYKELRHKLKELRDNNATREQIFEIATPYFNGWANALYDWWSLLDRTPKTDTAPSLFGLGNIGFNFEEKYLSDLGKPTIKFEFEDNASLADFLSKAKQNSVDYAETVDADTYSNPVNVNKRRQAHKATKSLTTTSPDYFPPSDSPKALPPSDSPRALPPSDSPKALPPSDSPRALPPSDSPRALPPSDSPKVLPAAAVSTSPDWDAIYERLVRASTWSSFHPERAARYELDEFEALYYSAIDRVPESRRQDFSQQFVEYVNDIARLQAAAPSAAVTGSGGITARKAARLNAANDRYMAKRAGFVDWIEGYIRKASRKEERQRPKSERDDARFVQIQAAINDVMTVKARGYTYRLNDVKENLYNMISTDANKGNVELVQRVLEYLVPLGLFTDKHRVWGLLDIAKNAAAQQLQLFDDAAQTQQQENGKYSIVYDTDGDRVRIVFGYVPDEKTRTWLKGNGFRWSPRNKAWQRQITSNARLAVRRFEQMMHDGTLGKPTIKLEFEDNDDLMRLFDTDAISGLTVNDKPAAVFNCPESQLVTQGYTPTYARLADYSHLIDAADGAKTLKGYGFAQATLDELRNACKYYRQVERLAAHLQDPDTVQTAFNVWHWLHTNVKYNYDTPGQEEIRTPARVWADRERGVDCDCLAVFTACLFLCMGYKPKFEIVAFNNSPTFSHIYVNLDGMAIDRVLPVFLARPGDITKTQIMDIPVYELSGLGGCSSLSGVYRTTLAKVENGTATGDDLNELRKTQVLVTLQGIDEDMFKVAALLMPHVVTIADDGTYYFDNAKMAQVAEKVDAQLALLKQQHASPIAMRHWLSEVVDEIDGVPVTATAQADGEDTIVVIINPKGCPCRVQGSMVSAEMPTIAPPSSEAAAEATQSTATETPPTATATPPAASLPPSTVGDAESAKDNKWWWISGIFAAVGVTYALATSKQKKNKRKR